MKIDWEAVATFGLLFVVLSPFLAMAIWVIAGAIVMLR